MKPKPWSYSALERFKNCPRQFYEISVAKNVKDADGEASIWGHRVHTAFEERLKHGVVLPDELDQYEPEMLWISQRPGELHIEKEVALNHLVEPCGKWDSDVWWRGKFDVLIINGTEAFIRDWKTGKTHSDFKQLMLFALWVFYAYPEVEQVYVEYYWTQTMTRSPQVYSRALINHLWKPFVGDLNQYAEAFIKDEWQPRQSGLCRGWCPVTECEFWTPKRK